MGACRTEYPRPYVVSDDFERVDRSFQTVARINRATWMSASQATPWMTDRAATVSLLRWLRRQLREPTPVREHLEAAVANDDPAEARRLLEGFAFSDAQRRHVEGLIDAWERERAR